MTNINNTITQHSRSKSNMKPFFRRTRFVCISDTHNASPADGNFKLPKGDVLIHAGDLTKQGTLAELRTTLDWIREADYEIKLVIAGNHDVTLDKAFYDEHGSRFHNQYPQDPQACIDMIKGCPSVTYLNHEHVDVRLTEEDGPRTGFRVFGSPYSPANGLWAFGYPPEKASELWDNSIPLDTDIVITHTPPKYHCDESRNRGAAGCEILRQKLWRVRPSLAICGHVHEARGAERIIWDLETRNVNYKEVTTGYWINPGLNNKKQSILDLSSRSQVPLNSTSLFVSADTSSVTMNSSQHWRFEHRPEDDVALPSATALPYLHTEGAHPATWGQGGIPPSGRSDLEALTGRLGRRETCCVNAALMASSWPYKSRDNRRYNKPIVVDIDLPVWQDEKDITQPQLPAMPETSLTASDCSLSR